MKIKIIHVLVLSLLPLLMRGQDFAVESFENVVNDLTAKTSPRIDKNGRKCALIKVYVNDAITAVDGPIIGDIIDRGMEKWLYVAHDAKQIQLLFKEHMPLFITFDDFNYPSVTGQMTYILKLTEVNKVNSRKSSTVSNSETSVSPSTQTSIFTLATNSAYEHSSDSNLKQEIAKPIEELDPVIRDLIDNMVFVEGGSFMMGSDDKNSYYNEKVKHKETVKSFSIGKFEVSQREWKAVMGNNPSRFQGDELPVEKVSWNDCQEFIRRLNAMTGMNFRLPTEHEWEYAARGGNKSHGYKYSGSKNIKNIAWYDKNSSLMTHKVGLKESNELGLHDMSGNVWEWTSSKWSGDDRNPIISLSFLCRGGSWGSIARSCRVSCRLNYSASHRDDYIGLRLAL